MPSHIKPMSPDLTARIISFVRYLAGLEGLLPKYRIPRPSKSFHPHKMDLVKPTTPSSKLYDVIIIGGSYAGLSAALTLYRAVHTCLIFDSGTPRNALATRTHLTSGWENESPHKSRETSRKELESSGLVEFTSQLVQTARKKADGTFEVVDSSGASWSARKILLAIGVHENYLGIEGYAENYGKLM